MVESTTRVRFGPDQIAWQSDVEVVAAVGERLASDLLRDPALGDIVDRLRQQPPDRLRIECATPEPLALPWELLPSAQGSVMAERGQILRVPLASASPRLGNERRGTGRCRAADRGRLAAPSRPR